MRRVPCNVPRAKWEEQRAKGLDVSKKKRCAHAAIDDFAEFYKKDGRLWVPYYCRGQKYFHDMSFDTARQGVGYALAILADGDNVVPLRKAMADVQRIVGRRGPAH